MNEKYILWPFKNEKNDKDNGRKKKIQRQLKAIADEPQTAPEIILPYASQRATHTHTA